MRFVSSGLVVVRIDRLARSLAHLLEIIETLDARGAGFRSLGDPIDTTSPQGRFTLQILGAVAEFERALIRERGIVFVRHEGRIRSIETDRLLRHPDHPCNTLTWLSEFCDGTVRCACTACGLSAAGLPPYPPQPAAETDLCTKAVEAVAET